MEKAVSDCSEGGLFPACLKEQDLVFRNGILQSLTFCLFSEQCG